VTVLLDRFIRKPARIFGIIGMVTLIPMMLLTTVDVILRTLFSRPILGAHEISGFMMVILVFMSLAYTLIKNGHTVIDLVTERLPAGVRAVMITTGYLFSTLIFALITWQSAIFAFEKWRQGAKVATIALQIYPFVFVVALGCGLMCLALLASFLSSLNYWSKK
jgi:TRAP-type C4-dicarboxylate transport system permease small subunit